MFPKFYTNMQEIENITLMRQDAFYFFLRSKLLKSEQSKTVFKDFNNNYILFSVINNAVSALIVEISLDFWKDLPY